MSEQPIVPHEVQQSNGPKLTQREMTEAIIRCACMFLLFERETETGVRAALGSLAQERHDNFHTKEGKNDGSSFTECKNEICVEVSEILENYRKPSVEFNQITAEMMETKYTLGILKGTKTVIVALKDRSKVDEPPAIPFTPQEGTIIKV